jgi:hypothetical protein
MNAARTRFSWAIVTAAYEAAIGIPAAALKITGNVKYHDSKADSGNTLSRGFYPECGSRLFSKTSAMTDLTMITAASLDDPSQYMPQMDIFVSSAQPWDHMNPALPKFANMPM